MILPERSASVLSLLLPKIPIKDETMLMSLKNENVINYVKDEAVNEILSRYFSFEQAKSKKYVYNAEDKVLVASVKVNKPPVSFTDLSIALLLPDRNKKLGKITIYVR